MGYPSSRPIPGLPHLTSPFLEIVRRSWSRETGHFWVGFLTVVTSWSMIHDRCHLFHQNQDLAKQTSDSDLFGEKCRGNLPTYIKYLPTFTIHTKKWGVLCVKMPNVPLVSVAWIHPCFHQSWDLACAWHFQKIASLKCWGCHESSWNKAGQNWQFDAICWFPSGDMTIPQSNYTIQLWTRPSENPTLDHGTPWNIRLCICEIVGVKHSTVYDKNKWRSLGVSKVMGVALNHSKSSIFIDFSILSHPAIEDSPFMDPPHLVPWVSFIASLSPWWFVWSPHCFVAW